MRSQVVAGTNYLMKIQVSEAADGFIHVKIYEPLPYTGLPAELHEHSDIVTGKKLEDPIEIWRKFEDFLMLMVSIYGEKLYL